MADHRTEALHLRPAEVRSGEASAARKMKDEDEGRIQRFRSEDDLVLAARIFAAPASHRLPLLCLPGLSRNSLDFLAVGQYFAGPSARPRNVIALDYRGRGFSEHDPNWRHYTPMVEANDVLAAAAALGIDRAILLGTSRGGLLAMLLGALRPALIAGIILNDIGPVLEGTGLARIKQQLTSLNRPLRSWEEAVGVLRANAGEHFPTLTEADWRAGARAFFVETQAGLVPRVDPHLARTLKELDVSAPIPDLWPQFESLGRVPLLAIRGEHSDLLSAGTLAEMAKRHPDCEQLVVGDQGHAPTLRDRETLLRIEFVPGSVPGALRH